MNVEIHLSGHHYQLLFELMNQYECENPSLLVELALERLSKEDRKTVSASILASLERSALENLGFIKALKNIQG